VRRFDAATASCTVFTFREGLFAAVGHDLSLAVTQFTIDIADDNSVAARFTANSLRVMGTVQGSDRQTIERHAADDVLAAPRFPEIRFETTSVVHNGDRAELTGELTIRGTPRPLHFTARDDGAVWSAEITLDQRDFGIKPFTAMLGTLRIKPEVHVRVTLPSR
jgi:polyisoprenoid-binding protein YceI